MKKLFNSTEALVACELTDSTLDRANNNASMLNECKNNLNHDPDNRNL